MTYYALFDKTNTEIKFGYDTYLSSNLVIGVNSNALRDRVLIYNEKHPENDLQSTIHLKEMDPEHKTARFIISASNLHQVEFGIYSFSNNSNAYLKSGVNTHFIIETSNVERMRFMNNGWIGIGTTRASVPFQVSVNTLISPNSSGAGLVCSNIGSGPALQVVATNSSTNSLFQIKGPGDGGVVGLSYLNNGNMYLFPYSTTNCLSLATIRSVTAGTVLDINGNAVVTGNIGIGTTVPSYPLHIQGDIYTSGTLYQSTLNQAMFSHVSSSTVGGGSTTANLYVTRSLNTVDYNDIVGASLNTGTGQVTLPAGKYHIRIRGSAYNCGFNRLRLFNLTTTAPVAYGMSHFAGSNMQVDAVIDTIYTPTTTATYIVQHWAQQTVTGNGFGVYNAQHASGYLSTNLYMQMHVDKLA